MSPLRCTCIRLLSLFVWVFLFVCFGFVGARSDTPIPGTSPFPAQIQEQSQTFLKGGLPAFPPFAYPNNGRADKGTIVELYRLLAEELNVAIDVQCYPYARTLAYLKSGSLDLAIVFKNPGLGDAVDYVGKISLSKVIVISRKGKPIRKYEDLYQLKSIAVIRKASFEARFDNDPLLKKIEVENYQREVLLLQNGRVEAIVGSMSGLQNAIDLIGADASEWEEPYVLGYKEWWVHFSNLSAHQSLLPELKRAVEKLYRPNLVFELYQKQSGLVN